MKSQKLLAGVLGFALTSAGANAQTALRPPSVPLVTHDPYFSVWSDSDRLTDTPTTHWTGKAQALSSLLRVDGRTYRLMGSTPSAVPALTQTGLQVLPTRTIYNFAGAGVSVRLIFTSPLLPADLELLSRPVTYVTWQISATDGKRHTAAVYLDASAAIAVNTPDQKVVSKREKMGGLTALQIGHEAQRVLNRSGDDLRIDWGYFYLAARQKQAKFALAGNDECESRFASSGELPSDDNSTARAVSDGESVAALTFNLGQVGAETVERQALLAYDDLYSIQYMGRNLRPYWRKKGANASSLLQSAARDYDSVEKRCQLFDAELMSDLTAVGGAKYARLAALSHRQALAAQKIVADSNGQPLSFSKENFSNGCIATVDVIYPAAPQMLALSPSLLKASLQPMMAYGASERWKFPFAPHDLGTYPIANGQVYGGGERTEDNQMPVEESGNLLILLGALSKVEGNTRFSDPFWPTITKWADYLAEKGFDPESQLSTDDFAGHLAHNVNLSAKAIVALGAYAQMAQMRGETESAAKYREISEGFAAQWVRESEDGDQTRLAFDKPGTWSQKYNLVWDRILGLNLFPSSVAEREVAFYKTKLNVYGLPLDSRRDYTKLDWTIWSATLNGNRADFATITDPLYDWANSTTSRVPLTDWYDTKTGRMSGFQARSVVGGNFIPLLGDAAIWKKWATRDKNRLANWAAIPKPPLVTELLPSGENKAGVKWKYTIQTPPSNWFAPDFPAAMWSEGEAGFGTSNTRGIAVRTVWDTGDIWLRRTFTSDGNTPVGAYIYGFHDENTDVYLNGVLVGRVEGYNTTYQPLLELPAKILKPGANVLAVHCRQTNGGQGIDLGISQVKHQD